MNQPAPLKTFIVYSSKDRELREQLESHLRALVDLEWITLWSDKEIAPGERWDKAIKDRLLDTEIFLMLVSVDFYNSGYIREEEFKTAITRLDSGDSMVIPIIVRPCDWESYPVIKDLQVLPPGGYAVTDTDHWKDRDKAWHTIAKKLRERIQELRAERLAADSTAERESARLHALRTEQERERHRQEAHNAAWAAASEQHSAAAYQQFLAAYPDSTNAREARHRIKTLRQADRQPLAWRQWAGIGAGVLALALLVWALNRDSVGVTLSHPDTTLIEKVGGVDFAMIPVAGGTYTMGSPATEVGRRNDECQHSVPVGAFSIGQTEVTQAQWKAVMGSNPSNFKGDKLPVENVSWDDVQEFIKKLNALTGKNFRLPTEEEWEYAAREGGKNVRFGNGKDIADPKEMNFDGSKEYKQPYSVVGEYREKTTPVGSFKPNALGLYDMSGNVWEWCEDKYGPYQGCSEPESISDFRVVRGGSWNNNPDDCRAACRYWNITVNRNIIIGFRLAR